MSQFLDTKATQLFANVQARRGVLSHDVRTQIQERAQAKGAPLGMDELRDLLFSALPDQKQQITDASQAGKSKTHQCDRTRGDFVTQIAELRIEKERAQATTPYNGTATTQRDPMFLDLVMDPDADVALIFNARDVDKNGRPLLMKAIVREGASLDSVDLSGYRSNWKDGAKPDVMVVAKHAAYVEVVDANETEFAHGDPVVVASFSEGEELSRVAKARPANKQTTRYFPYVIENGAYAPDRSRPETDSPTITTGSQLDTTPVTVFADRMKMEVSAKPELAAGAWIDAAAPSFNAKLGFDAGLMFEPDTIARAYYNSQVVMTEVGDDPYMLGSPAQSIDLKVPPGTLQAFMNSSVELQTGSGENGAYGVAMTKTLVRDLFFGPKAGVWVAQKPLAPLTDLNLTKGDLAGARIEAKYSQVPNAPATVHLSLTLANGFLHAPAGGSLEGWSIAAGYRDAKGQWKQAEPIKLGKCESSEGRTIEFDLENVPALFKANTNIELRVFTPEGVPAERVNLPIKEIGWC